MNVSVDEYTRMLQVYEESVLQTKTLSSLREAVEKQAQVHNSIQNKFQIKPTSKFLK